MKVNGLHIILYTFFIVVLFSIGIRATTKPEKIKKVDTKVLVLQTAGLAKKYIDILAIQGYEVKHIISQSVSISTGRSFGIRHGDIIIIMTKEYY